MLEDNDALGLEGVKVNNTEEEKDLRANPEPNDIAKHDATVGATDVVGVEINEAGNTAEEQTTHQMIGPDDGDSKKESNETTETVEEYDHEDTLRRLHHVNRSLSHQCMLMGYELDMIDDEEATRALDDMREGQNTLTDYERIRHLDSGRGA